MDIITYALCKKLAAAAVSGIKNITVNGTDLVISTNDGNTITMHFPTPKDGNSIVDIKIDTNNHLICEMQDGTLIDAGEIPGGTGGGVIQANRVGDFPTIGNEDTLYLSKEDEKLYYWNGTKYQAITPDATEVLAELETGKIKFDGIEKSFDLPIDRVEYNVYVNGIYMTQADDYTIDRSSTPNKIIFEEIWEATDSCSLTYLKATKPGEGGGINFDFATEQDILNLFKEEVADGN